MRTSYLSQKIMHKDVPVIYRILLLIKVNKGETFMPAPKTAGTKENENSPTYILPLRGVGNRRG